MGVSFLTPLGGLFALAAAAPLAALAVMERRTGRLRRLFSLAAPRQRDLVTSAVALGLLPALVAVAATQPVVIHKQALSERVDSQVFVIFDTSLSMSARSGRHSLTRLGRAKQEVKALVTQLGDIPVGIATMTDRVLPTLLPTTNTGLVVRTVNEAVAIDEPPPTLLYRGRATTLAALVPLQRDHLFAPSVKHPILVVFTDGEEQAPPPFSSYDTIAQQVGIPPLFVHVWAPTDRVYIHGRVDPKYQPDPTSGRVLAQFAEQTHGKVIPEGDVRGLLDAIRGEAGSHPATTTFLGYSRVALGPWFLLAGVFPLGFLFWRRNL